MSDEALVEGREIRSEDLYAEDLGARTWRDCTFVDVDLTEATSHGAIVDTSR